CATLAGLHCSSTNCYYNRVDVW
nr:immunoglobulin heavy chain junction region [Macaca mulatta]